MGAGMAGMITQAMQGAVQPAAAAVPDVMSLAVEVEKRLLKIDKSIKVAVMGCVVNGPGEAKDADVGIACGKGKGVIFKNGEKLAVVSEKDYLTSLMREVEGL